MRTQGAKGHCTGMTEEDVIKSVAFQYQQFCRYRHEIHNDMPDRRSRLFASRTFDGRFFEMS